MAINFTVIVKGDELEKALKKMKTKSIKSGLVKEMKEMLINTKMKKRKRERNM